MKMTDKIDKSVSDDEDDLEALRLAALQSLKKKVNDSDNGALPQVSLSKPNSFNGMQKTGRKRGRYFPNQMRNPKNGQFPKGQYNNRASGQFNNRVRNTNLISITPIQTAEEEAVVPQKSTDPPKLILPQDRYNKPVQEDEKQEGPVSKFDRYNNSESESDEEDESELSDHGGELKRSDSLEELMKELEDKIQGDSKPKEAKPVKNKTKRKKSLVVEKDVAEKSESEVKHVSDTKQTNIKTIDSKENEDAKAKVLSSPEKPPKMQVASTSTSVVKDESGNTVQTELETKETTEKNDNLGDSEGKNVEASPSKNRQRIRSPSHRKTEFHRKTNRNYLHNQHIPFSQSNIVQNPAFTPQTPFLAYNTPVPVINPVFLPAFIPTNIPPPLTMPVINPSQSHRSMSPLTINTDNLSASITAPLSPRSAAFVLENRAIIEKRRRSPRRSYSRSPSPRSRHSLSPRSPRSPRRSFTPKRSPPPRLSPRNRRSLTPKRNSASPRRFSRSPVPLRMRSPRRSLSPAKRNSPQGRRYSPKRTARSQQAPPKGSVYDRLGAKVNSNKTEPQNERIVRRSRSRSRSKTPLRDEKPHGAVDPVLEARRRKFESNEIKHKEGIIRLKPKDKNPEKRPLESKSVEKQAASKTSESSPVQSTSNKDQPIDSELPQNKPIKTENTKDENVSDLDKLIEEEDDKIDGLSDLNEDELLGIDETLDFTPPVDRLLSDEESDAENEGRFKAKTEGGVKVPILPFAKLVKGQNSEFKENLKVDRNSKDRTPSKPKESKRKRSPSPLVKKENNKKPPAPVVSSKVKDVSAENRYEKKLRFAGRLPILNRMTVRVDKPPLTTPIENKRIEIRIRNPSKYRRAESEEKQNEEKDDNKCVYTSRKVEITKRDDDSSSESDTEIVVENEDDSSKEDERNSNDGDLRAQLSRKRAERQKRPESERSSRLLHSALDGAIFKKVKKSKKEKELKKEYQALRRLLKLEKMKRKMNVALQSQRKVHVEHLELCYNPADIRLPIHLRLGIANPAAVESFVVKKKKSKKHRKRALEQV